MFLTQSAVARLATDSRLLTDPKARMDFFYRPQCQSYDWTRKYYLLGRDSLLDSIVAPHDGRILEVGCGTARNLISLARRHPHWKLYGLDASACMLDVAQRKLAGKSYASRIALRLGLADDYELSRDFSTTDRMDAVLFSYALAMIEPWKESIELALRSLRPGGSVYCVDFWDQRYLPDFIRTRYDRWFEHFGFHRRFELPDHFLRLERQGRGHADIRSVWGAYAVQIRFTPQHQ